MRPKRFSLYIFVLFLFCSSFLLGQQNLERSVVKRFLVVVGANDGGAKRVKLKYAISDAESVLKVFHDLGGVMQEDTLFLAEPDIKTFYTEVEKFRSTIEKARLGYSRIETFFYYSGHSDGENILLGEEKISYEDLKETINTLEADARIAILDSCASGAFARTKGGKKRKPFLLDLAYNMKGNAVLTSSSSDELSQESDLIKASFFTHYLISGMRGAADMNQDGRVTLNEAYQFSFNETLSQTTKTAGGPQHPYYDIEMTGTGDVIMTDIRRSSTKLVLPEDIFGRFFIHDKSAKLVVELSKIQGQVIELGLEAGKYHIVNIPEDQIFESRITLENGENTVLDLDLFSMAERQYTTPRGERYRQLRRQIVMRGFNTRPITNNVTMHTGSTLNKGEFTIGLGSVGMGISDKVQVGTNVLLYLFQVYNFNTKIAIMRTEKMSIAAGLNLDHFNLKVFGVEEGFTSYSPYIAISPRFSDKFRMHFGSRFAFFSGNKDIQDSEVTSTAKGTSIFMGFEFSLSNISKFLAEGGYDTTFNGPRLSGALLFGWRKFRLKLGAQYFRPKDFKGFTIPVIGIWWRFGS